MLEVGKPAPEFALQNQDGTTIHLSDFAGQWLVVYFYPKDDTPGCTTEACSFRDGYSELTKAKVAVVGISKDSVASHKKFADKYHLTFDLLADTDHAVLETYDAWQQKSMYGKIYMGIQRSTVLIDAKGIIRFIWSRVTPKDHAQEILKLIDQLND